MIDLREYCSKIKNQHDIRCSASCAVTELYEFRLNTIINKKCNMSTLFNYKATRNILQATGNIECSINKSMLTLILLGLIPDRYWPFIISKYNDEPSAFCYALGQNFKVREPIRIDYHGISQYYLLEKLRYFLEKKFAICFEFNTSRSCFNQSGASGEIPFPIESDEINFSMAVLAVGYDNTKVIKNAESNKIHEGAILFQNSLGKKWGNEGYGWLPFEYVNTGNVKGCWTIADSQFIDLEAFGLSYD